MKSTRKEKERVVEASMKRNASKIAMGVKKSTNGKQRKDSGCNENIVTVKEEHFRQNRTLQERGQCTPAEVTLAVTKDEVQQKPHFSPKIKLQLFPLNERTRTGLEKDGYNPHLELTLRARKKICSVLKHLRNKWGCSSVVVGEPMLFPFNVDPENLGSYRRWTLNDIGISAGDVHKAVGSPATFRLRYGWFTTQPNSSCIPFISTPPTSAVIESSDNEKIISDTKLEFKHQIEVIGEVDEPMDASGPQNAAAIEQTSSVGVLSSKEQQMDNGLLQSSFQWSDFLNDTSIGGLLSEASLQGQFNISDAKSNGIGSAFHPSELTSDSLDAFIANQLKSFQEPRTVSHGPTSSILDAEETCHSFAFQKSSSSGKDLGVAGSVFPPASSCDVSPKLHKWPEMTEVNTQHDPSEKSACQELKTESLSCLRVPFNDESSLGLSGIKWNDSLGPFDLGLSSHQIIEGRQC
ncbi:hypothetical protein Ancab_002971 [Ancistrocladus abbreviatus]